MFPFRIKIVVPVLSLASSAVMLYLAYALVYGQQTPQRDKSAPVHLKELSPEVKVNGVAPSHFKVLPLATEGTIGTEGADHPVTLHTPTLPMPRSNVVQDRCADVMKPLHEINPNYSEKIKYKIVQNVNCPPLTSENRWSEDKKVVVRSVYLDNRGRNGHPTSYVFMVEIDMQVLSRGSLVKCQVGNQTSTTLDYWEVGLAAAIRSWCPKLTHQTIVVHCYQPPVSEAGSRAFLFYKADQQSPIESCESEKPLAIPGSPVPRISLDKPTIVSCIATQYNQPPFLSEWVRYQKTIGVNHIQMIAEPSIHTSGALKDPWVKKAIDEGFLVVDTWHKWFSAAQIYDHSQQLAYEDCLYRFQGTYDYLFPHDADDFLVPVISDQRQLPYYVNKHCSNAGSCELAWYQMCPTCGVVRETGEDGNVTDTLSSFDRCRRITKAIHKIPVTYDISTHSGHRWAPGYGVVCAPIHEVYVAHVRLF